MVAMGDNYTFAGPCWLKTGSMHLDTISSKSAFKQTLEMPHFYIWSMAYDNIAHLYQSYANIPR